MAVKSAGENPIIPKLIEINKFGKNQGFSCANGLLVLEQVGGRRLRALFGRRPARRCAPKQE